MGESQLVPLTIVSLLCVLVALLTLAKAPPAKVLQWRGMTASSILQIPGVVMVIVIGLAMGVTMLFTGHGPEVKSPHNASQKYETNTGGTP